jgi:vacuolar-type H+-ATPase subunit H
MSLLEKLFDGQVYPSEQILPKSKLYQEAQKKQEEIKEKLLSELSQKQQESLQEYRNQMLIESEEYAKESFKMGVKIGAEFIISIAYQNDKSRLTDEE